MVLSQGYLNSLGDVVVITPKNENVIPVYPIIRSQSAVIWCDWVGRGIAWSQSKAIVIFRVGFYPIVSNSSFANDVGSSHRLSVSVAVTSFVDGARPGRNVNLPSDEGRWRMMPTHMTLTQQPTHKQSHDSTDCCRRGLWDLSTTCFFLTECWIIEWHFAACTRQVEGIEEWDSIERKVERPWIRASACFSRCRCDWSCRTASATSWTTSAPPCGSRTCWCFSIWCWTTPTNWRASFYLSDKSRTVWARRLSASSRTRRTTFGCVATANEKLGIS